MHPDFAAHPAKQFRGGTLPVLFRTLDREARAQIGVAPWRVLISGAFVRLRFLEDGRREMQIARTEKPKTDRGPQLWLREVDTFVQQFNITHWERREDPAAKGMRVVLTEPAPIPPFCGNCKGPKDKESTAAGSLICMECGVAAKRSGLVPCDRCGVLVPKEPVFDIMHCQKCALQAGAETVAVNRARAAEAVS